MTQTPSARGRETDYNRAACYERLRVVFKNVCNARIRVEIFGIYSTVLYCITMVDFTKDLGLAS